MRCILCNKQIKVRRRRCNACYTKLRRYRTKLAAVKYLGGRCVRCGYDESPFGLEFHHRDPSKKDFTISNSGNKSWEVIKKELDKCDLLCSCCHNIEHSKKDEKFLQEAMNYRGKVLGTLV